MKDSIKIYSFLLFILLFINSVQCYIGRLNFECSRGGYISFYYDNNCKDLKSIEYLECDTVCYIDFGNDNSSKVNNFYGNSIMIKSLQGNICSNSVSFSTRIKNCLPNPYSLKFTGNLSTSNGGLITMSGAFIRTTPLKLKSLSYRVLANNYSVVLPIETKSDFKALDFNSTKYTFKIGAGAGKIRIDLSSRGIDGDQWSQFQDLYYSEPVINSVSYDSNYITIYGDNFYNVKSLVLIQINSLTVDNKYIYMVDHGRIILINNYIYSGSYKIDLKVAGISTTTQTTFNILPIIKSVHSTSVSRYNGGPITITGSFLSGLNDLAPSLILFGNDKCQLLLYKSDFIICSLPKSSNPKLSTVQVYITVNGLKNLNGINFSYDPPELFGLKEQIGSNSQIIINGLNLGSYDGISKTNLYLNGLNSSSIIKSISNDETEIRIDASSKDCVNYSRVFVVVDGLKSNEIEIEIKVLTRIISSPNTDGSHLVLSLLPTCKYNFSTVLLKLNESAKEYPCKLINSSSNSIVNGSKIVTCNTIPGTGRNHSFYLSLDGGKIKTELKNYSYQIPIIHDQRFDGNQLTLFGKHFIGFKSTTTSCFIYFFNLKFNCSVINNNKVVSTLDDGTRIINKFIQLSIDGLDSDNYFIESNIPTINSTNDFIKSGNFIFNIYGFNFGSLFSISINRYNNGSNIENCSLSYHNSSSRYEIISCSIPSLSNKINSNFGKLTLVMNNSKLYFNILFIINNNQNHNHNQNSSNDNNSNSNSNNNNNNNSNNISNSNNNIKSYLYPLCFLILLI